MELSYQAMKTAHQAREADGVRSETRRRNLLILIFHYLKEEGYIDTAGVLEQETSFALHRFEACDNIDLETILMEYESYYFIRFQKYPKLTKKVPETCDGRQARSGGKKRTSSASHALPRISSTHCPSSSLKKAESKTAAKDGGKTASENGQSFPPEMTEFGLNVLPIIRSGAGEAAQVKRAQLLDYRTLIHDAVGGVSSDLTCHSDPMDRLLKPIGAFCGMNAETRELAAIISKDSRDTKAHYCKRD